MAVTGTAAEQLAAWREHPAAWCASCSASRPIRGSTKPSKRSRIHRGWPSRAARGRAKPPCLAWIGWNFLIDAAASDNRRDVDQRANLKMNLWTEFARWRQKSPLLMHLFEMTKNEIFSREHPKTWKAEARSWPADADSTRSV